MLVGKQPDPEPLPQRPVPVLHDANPAARRDALARLPPTTPQPGFPNRRDRRCQPCWGLITW
ncbi:MAG: hypothetical protein QOF58_6063 [Pseudonocardiales bacterium]|nr:hypothetical protein [Pseudonocardiales bacterium]